MIRWFFSAKKSFTSIPAPFLVVAFASEERPPRSESRLVAVLVFERSCVTSGLEHRSPGSMSDILISYQPVLPKMIEAFLP